ncbi:hypothetical protein CMV30_14000 [Nibricoccus aquaticus]|uniref:Periplasmic heavy metal sensor n=1 Tax=Nibricoccus aquaticus TaxID=2576891 RepID=A0A290Q9P8_9BACT|nr:hypothetical protein [Nibricoccus aquaticus]ATC64987.1 hypothetical protein CMV30_14000 [Nibricoccus aquaticus]
MKRFLPLFVVIVLAGAVAFGVTKWVCHKGCPDENTWLQTEFSLSNEQLAAIKNIRADYGPVCASHCSKLSTEKKRLANLEKKHGRDSADYLAALAAFEALNRECAEATRKHLEAIAAQMPHDQGRRYLEMVGPKITATNSPISPAAK